MPVADHATYCEMLRRARAGKFAYPAVNVTSLTAANAVLKGLADSGSDGIVQVSTGGAAFASGAAVKDMVLGAITIAEHVHRVAERYPIHVALHTDHCQPDKLNSFVMPLVEETERRRAAGRPNLFNGHMFDGSTLPLDANLDIAVTLQERFARNDLVLEIEVGAVGGEEDGVRASAAARLYTTPEDTLEVARRLGSRSGHPYLLAATFGNVHGVYKPGHVVLRPSILRDCQDAVEREFGSEARFYFVFHGGSGSDLHDIHAALDYGVVKMNVDTDMQYAFTRAIADHCFRNYDRVLRVDGEPGDKNAYDPRSYLALAEKAMADRVARDDGDAIRRVSNGETVNANIYPPNGEVDFSIARHGECRVRSPMHDAHFVSDDVRVLYPSTLEQYRQHKTASGEPLSLEHAGPREWLYFDPATVACGIVTCGGLCPGLNDVIRAIVLSLYHHYGVRKIYGFRFGFEGLIERHGRPPLELTPDTVNRIHEFGGSFLGSSRGPQDPAEMLDRLAGLGIGILFAIGGDGTLRGAHAISELAAARGMKISVIGVPKTIDNDVSYLQRTFGFETAVTEARRATYAANSEAESARNGVGLVKLMGRDSGFIAAYTVLADGQVNFCLVPEVPFSLERFLDELTGRLERRGHAVVVVAEGAGQHLMSGDDERDASGNVKLRDIGLFLREAITCHFRGRGTPISLKYIDPSYTIRSVPANAHDSAFCLLLGHNAVHAGMTGRTDMLVGFWNHRFSHVPIAAATSKRKQIEPDGELWNSVLASTGQPRDMS